MGIYNVMFVGGLILAILFFILTIVLFFLLKIPAAFGSVTGKTQKKAVEAIRASKSGEVTGKKRRKSPTGIITARDVKLSTATGTLETLEKKERRKYTAKAERDADSNIVKEAEMAAAKVAGMGGGGATSFTTAVAPKVDFEKEGTEVLTYGELSNSGSLKGNSEAATSVLGAEAIAGSPEATDVLSVSGGMETTASASIMDSESLTDVLREDGSVETVGNTVGVNANVQAFAGSEASTDVLSGNVILGSNTSINTPVQQTSVQSRPDYDKEETDILREGYDAYEPYYDQKSDAGSEADTAILTEDMEANAPAAKNADISDENIHISQKDVNGTFAEELTSVLKSDMKPDMNVDMEELSKELNKRNEARNKKDKGTSDKIQVLYSKTIVHTDETI